MRFVFFSNKSCCLRRAICHSVVRRKWNESGFRPPLCTYRLNWARRTSWGWWDDWDDTVLQTQDSKFELWRSEAEHATSRSRRLPTILTFTRGWGRNIFVSFKPPRPGTEPRTLAWKAAVLTTTLGPPPVVRRKKAVSANCKRQYLLTLQVSRYCLLPLQSSMTDVSWPLWIWIVTLVRWSLIWPLCLGPPPPPPADIIMDHRQAL